MASYHGIDLGKLGIASYEAGRAYGAGPGPGRVALDPPDALWATLKRLAGSGTRRLRATRFDLGRAVRADRGDGHRAGDRAVRHDMVFGHAHEIITRAACDTR
jgi:hypothetical protein